MDTVGKEPGWGGGRFCSKRTQFETRHDSSVSIYSRLLTEILSPLKTNRSELTPTLVEMLVRRALKFPRGLNPRRLDPDSPTRRPISPRTTDRRPSPLRYQSFCSHDDARLQKHLIILKKNSLERVWWAKAGNSQTIWFVKTLKCFRFNSLWWHC